MSSKISICSGASLLVGAAPISDSNDSTTPARLTINLFDDVQDDLLRAHPWSFATKRVKLSPLVSTPPYGYKYEFNKPPDMLRLLSIDSLYAGRDFKLEGGKILANVSALDMCYVFRNNDVGTWPPDFVNAVKYELASQIAYPIAKSDTLRQTLEQKAQYKLMIAKANNAMETPSQRFKGNPLLQARY